MVRTIFPNRKKPEAACLEILLVLNIDFPFLLMASSNQILWKRAIVAYFIGQCTGKLCEWVVEHVRYRVQWVCKKIGPHTCNMVFYALFWLPCFNFTLYCCYVLLKNFSIATNRKAELHDEWRYVCHDGNKTHSILIC